MVAWQTENSQSAKVTEEVKKNVVYYSVPNNPEKVEIVNTPIPNIEPTPSEEYEALVEEPLLDTNVEEFVTDNPDTVGWLTVDGTDIDFPLVQTTDNNYYLTHSYDGSYNTAGWIFVDYRNNMTNFDKNTIIYGHNRLNETMFATLKNLFTDDWYQTSTWGIDLVTLDKDTKWQIVSIYQIPAETYYIQTNFENDIAYSEFLRTIVGRSEYDFSPALNTRDKILTLSTCTNVNDGRIVVHAKLVKTQPRPNN